VSEPPFTREQNDWLLWQNGQTDNMIRELREEIGRLRRELETHAMNRSDHRR
jgi:hypothetical protein